jgi:hypothetical protein
VRAGPPLDGPVSSGGCSGEGCRITIGQDTAVSVERIAWISTVVICAGLAALSFAIGYSGYGWTVIAITLAAAVNLLPERGAQATDSTAGEPLDQ